MGKKTRTNRLLVVFVVALVAGIWSFTALVDTAWAKKPPQEPPPQEEPSYQLVDLGSLGGNPAKPKAINESGQIAGEWTAPSTIGDETRAFVLTPEDTNNDGSADLWYRDQAPADGENDLVVRLGYLDDLLQVVFAFTASKATDINDWGQVVGTSVTDIKRHAFLWDDPNGNGTYDAGEMLDLGTLGGAESDANAINNFGEVVGISETASGERHAFLWTATAGMIDLGTLGGPYSSAASINDAGQVAGEADITPTGRKWEWLSRAFVIDPEDADGDGEPDTWYRDDDGDGGNDLMVNLGTLTSYGSWAVAINEDGTVAGTSKVTADNRRAIVVAPEDSNGDGLADTWYRDADGHGSNDLMIDLGALDGTNESRARALNNVNQVVGQSLKMKGISYQSAPYLWENGSMQDLNTLTEGDTYVGEPFDINDAEQIVTNQGYILLPIEPTP